MLNMKAIVILIILLTYTLLGNCQDKNNSLTLSISNNGELQNVMHEFYFNPIGEYEPNNDVTQFNSVMLMFNLRYILTFKKTFLTIDGKYGYRKDEYNVSGSEFVTGKEYQSFLGISSHYGFFNKIEKIEVRSALGINIYYINDYISRYHDDQPGQILHTTLRSDGGFAIGITNLTGITYYIKNWFSLNTNISFGIMNFDLGGKMQYTIEKQDPVIINQNPDPYFSTYNLTTITKPDITFGIGFHF